MLSGHTLSLHERSKSEELLLEDPVSENDEEADISANVLYAASFEEFAKSLVQYDTIIWFLISLLLVLAWGVGLLMLLYLPYRRYVLQKDISSRKLYVTSDKIVYKAVRPSFLPFLGYTKIDYQIPLHLVVGIILEQGCVQSIYGIHTFRIESIAYGKAAPVDELQFQGVSNPELLRKAIIVEAAKCIQEMGSGKSVLYAGEGMLTPNRMGSQRGISSFARLLQSPSYKVQASPRRSVLDVGNVVPGELLLHKLEEVKQSVKKIESIVAGAQP